MPPRGSCQGLAQPRYLREEKPTPRRIACGARLEGENLNKPRGILVSPEELLKSHRRRQVALCLAPSSTVGGLRSCNVTSGGKHVPLVAEEHCSDGTALSSRNLHIEEGTGSFDVPTIEGLPARRLQRGPKRLREVRRPVVLSFGRPFQASGCKVGRKEVTKPGASLTLLP